MGSILMQALKLAPRLFWYFYARPSKAYDFFSQSKRNVYIFIWSVFFSGLSLGILLAIPHYLLYHNLLQSILLSVASAFAFASTVAVAGTFAFAGAIAGAVAVTGASTVAVTGAIAGSVAIEVAGAGNFAFADTFTFAGAIAVAGAFAFAGAFAGTGVVAGAFAFAFAFAGAGNFFLAFPTGEGAESIKSYEIILYFLAFFIGYFYSSTFSFIKQNRRFRKTINSNWFHKYIVTYPQFGKVQKKSLFWGSIVALIYWLLVFFNWKPELNEKILVVTLGFVMMPLFILHIPDYILSLPLWLYQRKKILKKHKSGAAITKAYEKSLLFSHEMLYLPLPGLHKVMVSMAGNKEIGIKETVKRINDLYQFTFQQKQAQKAIVTLGNDRETVHQYLHFLLVEINIPLAKTLSTSSRMAQLYLVLFEKTGDLDKKRKDNYSIGVTPGERPYPGMRRKEKQPYIPVPLKERLDYVCREMEKEEGYRFNPEMIHTLSLAQQLLASTKLKDFYNALDNPGYIGSYPADIDYFTAFEKMATQLQTIKTDLLKIEAITRFETKYSFLMRQKENLATLATAAVDSFYKPFRTIWQHALENCVGLVEQEIKLLQGSAVLAIDLKNREILVPAEGRMLYFTIHNKGRELALDITVTLQTEIPLMDFRDTGQAKIDVIEADTVKEIAIPISAHAPGKTTIRGSITFSDRIEKDKTLDFSFPITLVKKKVEFKEIENPYIVGQPLKGDTPFYFGREDAFAFIDKNITVYGAHHTIVCHGLRRTGKSSLLNRIESLGFTDKRLVPINLDMQGIEDENDFYATVSAKIRGQFPLLPPLPGPTVVVDTFSRFKAFLQEIKPVLAEKIIVLMIDEFEELQMRVEDGRISRTIFSNIRHLMQHEEKLIFLFCGTHQLEEMSADYWSIFFNTALYLRISRLKPRDAKRLIKEPVKDRLHYDDLAVMQILKMTGGQPYLTQLLCRTLVNALNETKKRNDAVIDDVDDAVEEIITGGAEHFSQSIWEQSNPRERLILSAAAEEITLRQLDFIGLESLDEKVRSAVPSFTRKHLLDALEKLVSREILEERELRYCFPVNLLRKWLAARYPLRKVREEI